MAYCTQAQIETALGGDSALAWISDLENTTIPTTAIASAIEWSTQIVDSYAAGTPGTGTTAGALWSSTPIQAKHCAIDLSVYVLYERIRREVPESVKDAYLRAIKALEDLRDGKTSWVMTETPAAQNLGTIDYFSSVSTERTQNPRRTMRASRDKL